MVGEVWQVGEVKISRVVELEATGGMSRILPDATREELQKISWLYPHFASEDGRMRGAIHALVVDTPSRTIVVDTCVGNDKERPNPAWNRLQTTFLDDLAAAGYPADSIDTVLCTHLHVDHVGWNTMLVDGAWKPTFLNARYLIGQAEYDFWKDDDRDGQDQIMSDSVAPIFDAGLVDLIRTDHRICDEVSLMATVGHTPGHVSVRISSGGEEALITGDFIHHPCQMARPDWSASVDVDPEQARVTRRAVFEQFAGTPTLIIGTHFHTPTAGRLVRDGEAFRLDV